MPQLPAPAPEGQAAGRELVERVAEGQPLDDRHVPSLVQPHRGSRAARVTGPPRAPLRVRARRTPAPGARGATVDRRGHADPLDHRVRAAPAGGPRRRAAGRRDPAPPRRALPPPVAAPGDVEDPARDPPRPSTASPTSTAGPWAPRPTSAPATGPARSRRRPRRTPATWRRTPPQSSTRWPPSWRPPGRARPCCASRPSPRTAIGASWPSASARGSTGCASSTSDRAQTSQIAPSRTATAWRESGATRAPKPRTAAE